MQEASGRGTSFRAARAFVSRLRRESNREQAGFLEGNEQRRRRPRDRAVASGESWRFHPASDGSIGNSLDRFCSYELSHCCCDVFRCNLVQVDSEVTMARPRGRKTAVRFSVGFDDATADELAQIAETNDTTIAWIVRRAVSEFIERHATRDRAAVPLRSDNIRAPSVRA